MKQTKWRILAWAAVLAVIAAVYFRSINPDKIGFYHDDGLYVVTAKALATSHGYRILSLPDQPWETKYPPFFASARMAAYRQMPAGNFIGNNLATECHCKTDKIVMALAIRNQWQEHG